MYWYEGCAEAHVQLACYVLRYSKYSASGHNMHMQVALNMCSSTTLRTLYMYRTHKRYTMTVNSNLHVHGTAGPVMNAKVVC